MTDCGRDVVKEIGMGVFEGEEVRPWKMRVYEEVEFWGKTEERGSWWLFGEQQEHSWFERRG